MGLEPTALWLEVLCCYCPAVQATYYTLETKSYQLLESRSILNPTSNVLDVAKPAWAPTLALINPYSPRILFTVLQITSSP